MPQTRYKRTTTVRLNLRASFPAAGGASQVEPRLNERHHSGVRVAEEVYQKKRYGTENPGIHCIPDREHEVDGEEDLEDRERQIARNVTLLNPGRVAVVLDAVFRRPHKRRPDLEESLQ